MTCLLDANAIYVKDYFDYNGAPLSYVDFIHRFNLGRVFSFILYFGIVNAIPPVWKTHLLPCELIPNDNIKRLLILSSAVKPTRLIYKSVLNHTIPTCIEKWVVQNIPNDTDWNVIFKLPFVAIKDPKVQYFQFRFLHRILGINSYLYKLNIIESPLCSFCRSSEETIQHLFWECRHVQTFWRSISNSCIKIDFNLNHLVVFFGHTTKPDHPLNFFLLHAKFFIFSCKLNNTKPSAPVFIKKLKFLLSVEEYISRHYLNRSFEAYNETLRIPSENQWSQYNFFLRVSLCIKSHNSYTWCINVAVYMPLTYNFQPFTLYLDIVFLLCVSIRL